VELEGIEPSSKRGNHKLSTCLSLPKFSSNGRTKAINRCLILLRFHSCREADKNYPRCNCTTESECFGATASEWCLVPAPGAGIKLDLLWFD